MTTPAASTPTSEFRVDSAHTYDTSTPVRWIVSHVSRYPLLLVGFVLSTLAFAICSSLVPRIAGLAFDAVDRPDAGQALLTLSLLLMGVVFARGLADFGTINSIERLAQRLERDARSELTTSLLGKSQAFHDRQRVGDVMARAADDVRQLNLMFSPGVQLILDSLINLVTPLVFIAAIDVRMLLFPLLFVAAFAWALRRYSARLDPVSTAMREAFGHLSAGLNETIAGIELVKAAAAEPYERRRFAQNARAFRDQFVRQGDVQARYLPYLLVWLTFAATFGHGLLLLGQGSISVGELVAVIGLVGVLRGPADLSIFTFAMVQMGLAGARRTLALINEETELDENPEGYAGVMKGDIRFEDVTFTFPGAEAPTLERFTFHARPGETVAIVGQTGSGKSTLTKLVNRTFDVDSGRVLVDGIDVRDWNMESLRQQISVIEQEVFLFSRSVRDNIAFGLPGATFDQVVAAAKAAQAHGFITELPQGYDTVIGERGATLSGGQRQRLAIARALLTDPRILILDDATSAIDSATEDEIQTAINAVLKGRTSLVITHRLSQIRRADRIIMLDRSRLVDQGTHAELLERNELYQRIFQRYD
ncbi:MAG: ABC transporter ATP-binding protein [Deinococcales bacterium]|nr:ABC transporter ATP-binding protein [Deinococcales bacterium]